MSLKQLADKPLPNLLPETREFWEATAREELLVQECGNCGEVFFFPRTHCPNCLHPKPGWRRATGKGTILSFTVIHQALLPSFEAEVPYVYAIVELEEGVRMMTNIVGAKPDEVQIGAPVEVVFDPIREGVRIPRFRLHAGDENL